MPSAEELLSAPIEWDAVIIGTGMGGSACGFRLATLGKKVLFLERGTSTGRLGKVPRAAPIGEQPRLARGWWPNAIETEVDGVVTNNFYPLGCGVGGSTLMYGAALERLDQRDFEPGKHHTQKNDSLLPDVWPFSYADIAPYYEEVEKIFSVCGTIDPLEREKKENLLTPPALTSRDQALVAGFEKAGLHPYRLPVSIKYEDKCAECIGFACARSCKIDAQSGFLAPALAAGASLVERCEVKRINANETGANGVSCSFDGQDYVVEAKNVILAAGTLASPGLLLNSTSKDWPQGLANNTDMVGRCLMFHIGNQFAVWPKGSHSDEGPRKTLALKDFYVRDGLKFGAVQAVGVPAGRGNIQMYLKQMIGEDLLKRIPFANKALGVISLIAEKIFGKATVFTAMLEDLPYRNNRVVLANTSSSGFKVEYHIRKELEERARKFRSMVTKAMRYNRTMLIDRSVRLNYGHPIGSIRAGVDPETSVVRSDNRAHDVEGLYVVDGSFFPSSGGVNPSLTIAANALRVGDIIGGAGVNLGTHSKNVEKILPENLGREYPDKPVNLKDKIVAITGAGSGLGKALALGFVRDGAIVIAIGRHQESLDAVKAEAAKLAPANADIVIGRIETLVGDVSIADEAPRIISEIEERFERIDILINNAAVYKKATFKEEDMNKWWSAMATNVLGPAAMSAAALPLMECNGFGRIIMVGSFADRAPLPASSSYAVSKGALHTLTKALAEEVNRGKFPDIAINEFVPLPMQTGMGSVEGIGPDVCYPWVKKIVSQPAHGSHGAVFFKDEEIRPPKSFKRRIFEKLPFVNKT